MGHLSRVLMFVVLVLVGALLFGCKNDSSEKLKVLDLVNQISSKKISVPTDNYSSVAWISDNQIALSFGSTSVPDNGPNQIAIYTFNQETYRLELLNIPTPIECSSSRIGWLSRLPTKNLGFLQTCHIWEPPSDQIRLYSWNPNTKNSVVLQQYPKQFWASDYSFSPDMSQLLQEEQGGGTDDKVYKIDQNGNFNQLYPDWQRVSSPSWSSNGDWIAFAGTQIAPKAKSSIFTGLVEIQNVLFYPWDLFLIDVKEDNNLSKILSNVRQIAFVKWSPKENHLAFRGDFQEQEGLWIFNLETEELIRVWNKAFLSYDWSPDGTKIIILQEIETNETELYQPIIIELFPEKTSHRHSPPN